LTCPQNSIMNRRQFTKILATGISSLALNQVGCSRTQPDQRPNIIFIMTDQQSAGMLSCAGNRWLQTPNLDRLAASGIRFENAYCCNPVCVPSRFSLQTGRYPSAIGMGRNEDEKVPVPDAIRQHTLGNLFRNAGYETVYGGKVHLPVAMNDLEAIGFRKLTADSRQTLAEASTAFIQQNHSQPFFLFASFINPHDICYMAINDFRRSEGKPASDNIDSRTCETVLDEARKHPDLDAFVAVYCPQLPANHEIPAGEPECITRKYVEARAFRNFIRQNWTVAQWRLHRWAYCRLTEQVDAEIGLLLSALDTAGLAENTLVVFTSDHGDLDAAHKLEHKCVLYEEAVQIPFIIRFPGVIPAAVNRTHLVSNGLDLLPTLCDFAGIPLPEEYAGSSLRPLATGQSVSNWRGHLVVESQNGRMIRNDHFKYCIYDSGDPRGQLTDLKNDPGEMHNLVNDPAFQNIRQQLAELLT